jgi:hypothetical protein
MAKMADGHVIDASPSNQFFASHKNSFKWLQRAPFWQLACLHIGAARKTIRYFGLAIN